MADYVLALEPITTASQLERTKGIIKQFVAPQGLGPRLHQYLMDKREAEDNWVSRVLYHKREFLVGKPVTWYLVPRTLKWL